MDMPDGRGKAASALYALLSLGSFLETTPIPKTPKQRALTMSLNYFTQRHGCETYAGSILEQKRAQLISYVLFIMFGRCPCSSEDSTI
jgi:hypothetical protein